MQALNTEFDPFPFLHTKRLQLRAISLQDAARLYALRTNEQVMRYLDRPMLGSLDAAREMIERSVKDRQNGDGINWAISLQSSELLIGTIGFWRMEKEHFRAEIGYMLLPDFQQQGLMQEAMEAVIDYGFQKMRLHSIEANVNPDNRASIRLLERNGFVREAYFKENHYYNGQFLDSVIYSLLTKTKLP